MTFAPRSLVVSIAALSCLTGRPCRGEEAAPDAADKAPATAVKPWTVDEVKAAIKALDERQRNSGDYRTNVYIERKEKNKNDVVLEATVFRRDADDKLMILFNNPKAEKGKGYLRIDKNLWAYDPTVGKWDRRTERERIGGTDSRRADFDESRLAEEYEATYEGLDKLGKVDAHRVTLNAKKGVDVAYPKLVLWLSVTSGNTLKRQEYAASGKLMRTSYTPKWAKKFSPSKKAEVWTPREIRIFDEVEKGNSTIILMKEMDLNALPANLFTKAWLESQSR
jgi:hypothetical protein